MSTSKRRRILVATLASALVIAPAVLAGATNAAAAKESEKVRCYGVNKCKGTGDCGGKDHSCANQNACKRQGYVEMDRKTCLRLDGGRLTPEPEESEG
jgi:uncharacterized membrane protein